MDPLEAALVSFSPWESARVCTERGNLELGLKG